MWQLLNVTILARRNDVTLSDVHSTKFADGVISVFDQKLSNTNRTREELHTIRPPPPDERPRIEQYNSLRSWEFPSYIIAFETSTSLLLFLLEQVTEFPYPIPMQGDANAKSINIRSRHWSPLSNQFLKAGWMAWVIRIGLPAWSRKSLKISRTKVAQKDANGLDWMALALNPLSLIQFWSWKNSLFSQLALWGNKKWPPSMKVKKLKIFWDKMSSKGCKWSS